MSGAQLPKLPLRLLHVATLSALALTQPLFGMLLANPLFLVVRRTDAAELWAFAIVALLLPAALLATLDGLAERLPRRSGVALHLGLMGVLFALILAPAFNRAGWFVSLAGPIAAAGAFAYGYARVPTIPLALTWLSPAIVLVPAVFVARAPVASWRWGSVPLAEAAQPVLERTALHPLPVAMIVFDELPLVTLLDEAGRVDPARYPNFASLQRDALWVRNATADASHTRSALPALLTGRLPAAGRPYDVHATATLFARLSNTHAIAAHEPLLTLCPDAICKHREKGPAWLRVGMMLQDATVVLQWILAPPPLRAKLEPPVGLLGSFGLAGIARARGDETGEEPSATDPVAVRQQLGAWQRDTSGRPTFHFAHVMLPHQPFVYLPTGQRYRDRDSRVYAPWESEDVALEYRREHVVQAAYADAVLGLFLERVKQLGIWDDGVVVVTADHGLAFVTGSDPRNADERNLGDVAWVPLFVRTPGGPRAVVSDAPASSVDVAATVLDSLGMKTDAPIDGRSVLRASSPRQRRIVNEDGRELPLESTTAPMKAALRRKLSHVGSGSFENAFRSGSGWNLMFQRLEELPTGEPAEDVLVSVANPHRYDEVDRSGPSLPALVSGTVVASRSVELAVALNGRIAALRSVERARLFAPPPRWEALLPWMLLRDGRNDLAVFEVDRAPGGARLRKVRLEHHAKQ